MNPFEQKPKKSLMEMVPNWKQLAVKPYDKLEADLTPRRASSS